MSVPQRLRPYPCEDFLASPWAADGFYCEAAQVWVLSPADEAEAMPEIGFLAVGRPGVDGLLFGYRAGLPGLWTYYPIDNTFEPLAPSVAELVRSWQAGEVTV